MIIQTTTRPISLPEAASARETVQGEWGENVTGYVVAFLREVRLRHPDRLKLEE